MRDEELEPRGALENAYRAAAVGEDEDDTQQRAARRARVLQAVATVAPRTSAAPAARPQPAPRRHAWLLAASVGGIAVLLGLVTRLQTEPRGDELAQVEPPATAPAPARTRKAEGTEAPPPRPAAEAVIAAAPVARRDGLAAQSAHSRDAVDPVARLQAAAERGDTAAVMNLLAHGVPVDLRLARGNTGLQLSLLHRHYETAKAFLDRGADVEIKNSDGVNARELLLQVDGQDRERFGLDIPPPQAHGVSQPGR